MYGSGKRKDCDITEMAMWLEEEFYKANCKKLTPRLLALQLCPPAEGFLKKNVDGVVNDVRGVRGLGVVIRNHERLLVGVCTEQSVGSVSVLVTELLVLQLW